MRKLIYILQIQANNFLQNQLIQKLIGMKEENFSSLVAFFSKQHKGSDQKLNTKKIMLLIDLFLAIVSCAKKPLIITFFKS